MTRFLAAYEKLQLREFIGLSTFQFLAYLRRSIFYVFVSLYLYYEMGLSNFQVTLMATFGMIANAGGQAFLWGNLLDRIKRSAAFVMAGEVVAGVGHLILYWWHLRVYNTGNLRMAGFTIIIGLTIIELAWSASNTGWSALISELTVEHNRKRLFGQLSVIGGLGGIAGATFGSFLYQGGKGFINGSLFYIPAIIMIISGIIVYGSIRIWSDTPSIAEIDDNGEPIIKQSPPLSDLDPQIRHAFIIFWIALIFINFGRNSIALLTSLYLASPGGFNATEFEIGLFRNVSSAATMVAGAAIGSIIATVHDHKVMTSGAIMAIFSIIWLTISPTYELTLVTAALVGATQVILQSASYSIVANITPPDYRGRLFSYYNATFFLSWGLGATFVTAPIADYLIGQGFSYANAYRVSFIFATALVAIGLIILLYAYRVIDKVSEPEPDKSDIMNPPSS